ncbi:MAG: ketopantoate reductase family protein [Longimicrobiales bacterium]
MRIVIVGAGGVGGYFGGRWAEAGLDVTFLVRGAHLEVLRAEGLRLESPLGGVRIGVPAAGTATEVGEADLIVVATKTWQLQAAAENLGPMVGPGTIVMGLQNGVEAAGVLSTFVPISRVLGATCRIMSFIERPGVVRHAGVDPTIGFGELPGSEPGLATTLLDALDGAKGMTLRLEEDIEAEIWRKFLFIAPVSGVGSVTRAPIGVIRTLPETRRMLEVAVLEVLRVALARGVPVEESAGRDTMGFIDTLPHEGTSSMQRDFRDGRRTELEALSGAVVRFGAGTGVDVPVHSAIYSSLLPLEMKARGTLEFAVT